MPGTAGTRPATTRLNKLAQLFGDLTVSGRLIATFCPVDKTGNALSETPPIGAFAAGLAANATVSVE